MDLRMSLSYKDLLMSSLYLFIYLFIYFRSGKGGSLSLVATTHQSSDIGAPPQVHKLSTVALPHPYLDWGRFSLDLTPEL